MRRSVLALMFGVWGCGGGTAAMDVTFSDELVEAPARTVEITVVDTNDCEPLLSVPHEEVPSVGTVLATRQTSYPVEANQEVMEELPTGRALAFDVAVYDAQPRLIARNCVIAEISASADTTVVIPALSLPVCQARPSALDLTLVLDLSGAAGVADASLGSNMMPLLQNFVRSGFPTGTTLSIVTHGPADPTLIIGPTSAPGEVEASLGSLASEYLGVGKPYEALTLAAGLQRARAVCSRRPVVLTLMASADFGNLGAIDEALIGIAAARGDPNDDIFTAGVGLSVEGNTALTDLVTEDLGLRYGALTADALSNALAAIRLRLNTLINLVD